MTVKQGEWELYNLARDRGESENLAAKNPAKVRELAARWTQHLEETMTLALSAPAKDVPAAAAKKGKRAQQD